MDIPALTAALSDELPSILRWSGAVARRMREFDISVDGKESGNSNTDALTLADLTVQELLVAAMRDGSPLFRQCRIEGEESTGDMELFDGDSELAIAIDPIDGTKQYRDRSGDGWAIIVMLQSPDDVLYSLVYVPECGPQGTWVEVRDGQIRCGPDDTSRPAADVIRSIEPVDPLNRPKSKKVYMIGYQEKDREKAASLNEIGLTGVVADDMPGSIFPFMATGEYAGSLIHTPNIYDFPVSMQMARVLGGDALWVHNRQPVNFHELWMDDRAGMFRLPGVVACSDDRDILEALCDFAADWNPERYG